MHNESLSFEQKPDAFNQEDEFFKVKEGNKG